MKVAQNGNVSFWYAELGGPPKPRAPLPGDREVDVCIIGAGFTGLWTAWYLKQADPDVSVAVVEREFAGFGASGRNGGFLTGAFPWARDRYLQHGHTREGVIALERTLRGTVDEVIAVADAQGIDAGIHRTDELFVACTQSQLARIKADHANAMRWQVPPERLTLIGAREVADRVRVHNALGAMAIHGVARVQPAKLVRGLADAVERAGVAIYEKTTVQRYAKGRVDTDRGTIRASRIIRATEGYTAGFPGESRTWLAMNSAQIVTEPVPEAIWDQIGWRNGELLADAAHTICYAQRTADNRIAMGGRGVPYRFGNATDKAGETQETTVRSLHAILHRLLPQAARLKLDHAWCGVMGVPRDWCASVGFDPATGIGHAGGYVGVGVSTSNLAGQTLADLALGRKTELTGLPWVNHTVRKWEPEPLRWLGVQGMYGLYSIADRIEARGQTADTSRLAQLANLLTGR
ncbi:NAD(P)/FAD-dependent oxidoreductase [Ruegeria halocynthiae]|uniref:NAD(P)/FAD-dependent oxidoreductase n=1 Tax=Ruegeria halocynthiae TaxID=985054 RepID=UPI00055E8F01|nr:FAD-binding oxidoreductase [Ruegeria halocynthiae]